MTSNSVINLLWTGGLDSTFRLVELARQNVEIQPYYVIDKSRKSTLKEISAMYCIFQALRKKNMPGIIHDIIKIDPHSILSNSKIFNSYSFFRNYNSLGSQYEILARFAEQYNLVLEVGLEDSERGKASTILRNFGHLELKSYRNESPANILDWESYYVINLSKCNIDTINVFKNFRYPAHLFSIQKTKEAQLLIEWGCEDILNYTWFCHDPVFGYPCGHCNPCKDALNEGMRWRVPPIGRILGSIRRYYRGAKNRYKRLR